MAQRTFRFAIGLRSVAVVKVVTNGKDTRRFLRYLSGPLRSPTISAC
jgi:hypothetical protein